MVGAARRRARSSTSDFQDELTVAPPAVQQGPRLRLDRAARQSRRSRVFPARNDAGIPIAPPDGPGTAVSTSAWFSSQNRCVFVPPAHLCHLIDRAFPARYSRLPHRWSLRWPGWLTACASSGGQKKKFEAAGSQAGAVSARAQRKSPPTDRSWSWVYTLRSGSIVAS
jgi:hypothetical protein